MKKNLFFILSLCIFIACSKGEEDEEDLPNYIKITAKYDTDIKGPKGRIMVFELKENHIIEQRFSYGYLNDDDDLTFWMYDVNNELVFPFLNKELNPNKDSNTGLYVNQSTYFIGSDDLPYSVRDDEAREILILIAVSNTNNNVYTYKVLSWGRENLELTKIFKSSDNAWLHHEDW
ncbi:MAG: hypothetical protein AAGU19_08860 [Prolixibacteraceae bacterium]